LLQAQRAEVVGSHPSVSEEMKRLGILLPKEPNPQFYNLGHQLWAALGSNRIVISLKEPGPE
jgi:hypothetical protein